MDTPVGQGELTHHEAIVNGVRLHYVQAGQGPLVVLLHGFPEFWYGWRLQIPALAAAGYRVIAPDMRGYNLSEKPPTVADYRMEALTSDVAALIRHAGEENTVVVGHDWGGAVAWETAIRLPQVVRRLVVLNAPHPAAMLRELRTVEQLRRSWYMFFFQLPWLPEALARLSGYSALEAVFRRDPTRAGAYSDEDIRLYRQAAARPGALTGAINYYRALFRQAPAEALRGMRALPTITVPTLLIWGMRDRYLGPRLLNGLDQWVANLRVERLPDASHWVMADEPQRVNDLLLGFLRDGG